MRAGLMKHRVTFQSKTSTPDTGSGGIVETWADYLTCRVQIISLAGNELLAAQAVHAKANVKVKRRYDDSITPQLRMVHGSVIYDIHSVSPVPDSHGDMTIICSSGVTQG